METDWVRTQGKDPANLAWYRQAEIVHCRFAMLGVAGIVGPDIAAKVRGPESEQLRRLYRMHALSNPKARNPKAHAELASSLGSVLGTSAKALHTVLTSPPGGIIRSRSSSPLTDLTYSQKRLKSLLPIDALRNTHLLRSGLSP